MRYATIKEIDEAGFDLRLWCYACAHEKTLDGIMWMLFEKRGWRMDIESARTRFSCTNCDTADDVLLLPATPTRPRTASTQSWVEYWFHNRRGGGLLI